jgi:hypothetical protein
MSGATEPSKYAVVAIGIRFLPALASAAVKMKWDGVLTRHGLGGGYKLSPQCGLLKHNG